MKKILVAIGNINIFNKLKEENEIEVVSNDILYREGILEKLEENSNIDFIIINNKIPGQYSIEDLIYLIKLKNEKIKIILIGEENKNVYCYFNEINYENIINKIINKKENNNKLNKNIDNKIFEKVNIINNIQENNKKGKIISIIGTGGIGKSVFTVAYAKELKNKKVLIVDFDLLNNTMEVLLDTNDFINKNKTNINNEFSEYINKTKYDIDLISGVNFIIDNEENNYKKIEYFISNIGNYYDYVLVDISNGINENYKRILLNNSNNIIFISGANILEIKKSVALLEKYCLEWNIEKNKINIILNKYNKQSVDDEIIKNIFSDFNVIGKIKNSEYIDLLINSNNLKINKLKKEINKINKKLQNI